MELLVTGGAGFIGSNFIRYILHNNCDIKVLNLDGLKNGSNIANLSDLEKDRRYTFISGDITNFSLVSQSLSEI
jgi:dTDP-glucose 4,6-dehydratase